MSEPVYITVYEDQVAVSNTVRYSVESYAYAKQTDSDAQLVNLLRALMKYGDSAYNYVYAEDNYDINVSFDTLFGTQS